MTETHAPRVDLGDVMTTLRFRLLKELESYAESRSKDVVRGAETPELAAVFVEKYGQGLAKAAAEIADLLEMPGINLMAEVDQVVFALDPKARENRERQWAQRPAALR